MKSQEKIWNLEYSNSLSWKRDSILPPILEGKSVLELGVGTGKTLKAILKQKPKKVTAIDISSEAIILCKKDFSLPNVHIQKANALNLPFKEEFDVVVCYYILNNLLKKQRMCAVKEIRRVLKLHGVVLFEDFSIGDFRNKRGAQIENHTIQKKNGLVCHFFTKRELKSLFSSFSLIEIQEKEFFPIRLKQNLKRRILSATICK